jgi:hypothetical protein
MEHLRGGYGAAQRPTISTHVEEIFSEIYALLQSHKRLDEFCWRDPKVLTFGLDTRESCYNYLYYNEGGRIADSHDHENERLSKVIFERNSNGDDNGGATRGDCSDYSEVIWRHKISLDLIRYCVARWARGSYNVCPIPVCILKTLGNRITEDAYLQCGLTYERGCGEDKFRIALMDPFPLALIPAVCTYGLGRKLLQLSGRDGASVTATSTE